MKKIKITILIAIVGLFAISLSSCSKCDGEDPRAKITNNGTDKASVQIKTSGGNTVNINNVDPGTSSAYSSYASGSTTFTITVKSVEYEKTVNMLTCYEYDIQIDANNVITSIPVDRNE